MSEVITRVQQKAVDQNALYRGFIVSYVIAILGIGLLWPAEQAVVNGLLKIMVAPSVLVSDYMVIGGPGAALVNAGLVGLIGIGVLMLTRTAISGSTVAALFTMCGFALFGKNPLNVVPIMAGVFLYASVKREPAKMYVMPALFGTALGPLVSQLVFGLGLSPVLGVASGVIAGFLLAPLAGHLLHNHQGHNLYNVGFTAGIVGTVAFAVLKAMGLNPETAMHWGVEHTGALAAVFAVYFGTMVALGVLSGGTGRRFADIIKMPGTLVTDFVLHAGFPTTLINMGLIGLIGLGYVYIVGGDLNGPTLGGILTMVGFAAFGKHPKNTIPVMLGVWLGCLVQVWRPTDPGALLAALFGTTLAPIAGSFGVLAGALAGFVHLATVMHVGVMHGGMNLYNNGLAGGIVATLFVAVGKSLGSRGR